jgi:hypothetical protein
MVLFLWGALSDERTGLSCVYAASPRQRSLSRARVPWISRLYFTVSVLILPFSSPPTTRRVTVEVFDPAEEQTFIYSKHISRDHYPASILARQSDLQKTHQWSLSTVVMSPRTRKTQLPLLLRNLATDCLPRISLRGNLFTNPLPSNRCTCNNMLYCVVLSLQLMYYLRFIDVFVPFFCVVCSCSECFRAVYI